MVRNNKTRLSSIISLLLAVILCFTVFTSSVSAEDGKGKQEKRIRRAKSRILKI